MFACFRPLHACQAHANVDSTVKAKVSNLYGTSLSRAVELGRLIFCAGKGISLPVPSWNDLTASMDDIAMAVSNGDTEYACKLSNTKQATVKMFKGKTQVLMSMRVYPQPSTDKCHVRVLIFVDNDNPPPPPFSSMNLHSQMMKTDI